MHILFRDVNFHFPAFASFKKYICQKQSLITVRSSNVFVSLSTYPHCRKMKFRTFLHLTLISKNFMMSWFSDFVVCSTNLYIWSSGVYF